MNVQIRPFSALLSESYLYDGDKSRVGTMRDVRVIGASVYAGCYMTFHVLVDNKYMFSDIPIVALQHREHVTDRLDIHVLSHSKLSIGAVESFELGALRDRHVAIYARALDRYVTGTYVSSFDFFEENELLHLMKLDNGQFMLAPNHKVNWSGDKVLPDFKKNHTDWSK